MKLQFSSMDGRFIRALTATIAAGCAMTTGMEAKAAETLNATGIADGFSLSTFYTDPSANYGLLGAVNIPGGMAIGSGYARGEIYKFKDVDGQAFGSALQTAAAGGTPTGIAAVGGKVYVGLLGGSYYSVDTTTLAMTPLALSGTVNAAYGLWGNQSNGHLIAGTSQGLLDINPMTGTSTVVGLTGGFIDGVTVSPDGKIAYVESGSANIYGYSLTSPNPSAPVFSALGLAGGPDGTGVISGGKFNGDIIVNNNDGTVGLINHTTGIETVIASGGSRGDLVSPDTSNGTLFLTTSDQVYRLSCGVDCSIGSPPVPEPATVGLFGLGLIGLLINKRCRVGTAK